MRKPHETGSKYITRDWNSLYIPIARASGSWLLVSSDILSAAQCWSIASGPVKDELWSVFVVLSPTFPAVCCIYIVKSCCLSKSPFLIVLCRQSTGSATLYKSLLRFISVTFFAHFAVRFLFALDLWLDSCSTGWWSLFNFLDSNPSCSVLRKWHVETLDFLTIPEVS